MFLEFLETNGFVPDISFVIGVFSDPYVGDRHGHGRSASHPNGNPFPIHGGSRIVVIGIDKNHLDPFFFQPKPPDRRILPRVGPSCGVRIIGPINDHLRTFQSILEKIILFRHAKPPEKAVGVCGPPVPPFPAVRIVKDGRVLQHIQKPIQGAHFVADDPPIVMGGGHTGDRRAAVSFFDPFYFTGHHIQGFIPADPFIRRLPTVFLIPLSFRVEICSDHGVFDAVFGVEPPPFTMNIRGEVEFIGRAVFFPARLNGPGFKILIIRFERSDPDNPAISHVDGYGTRIGATRKDLFRHRILSFSWTY